MYNKIWIKSFLNQSIFFILLRASGRGSSMFLSQFEILYFNIKYDLNISQQKFSSEKGNFLKITFRSLKKKEKTAQNERKSHFFKSLGISFPDPQRRDTILLFEIILSYTKEYM